MRRAQPLAHAVVLGVLLLTAPASVADDIGYNDGETGFTIAQTGLDLPAFEGGTSNGRCALQATADPTPDGSLGGPATYTGALVAVVTVTATDPVTQNPVATRVACEVRVNGVSAASASGSGSGLVLVAAPVRYTAAASDVVALCTIVDSGTGPVEDCAEAVTSPVATQQGADAVDAATLLAETASCPALAAVSPGLPDQVDVAADGDVSVRGELLWDCAPYAPTTQANTATKATATTKQGAAVETRGGGGGGGGGTNNRHDLTSTCQYKYARQTGTITIAGTARAGSHSTPTATQIHCRLLDTATGAVVYDQVRTEQGSQATLNEVVFAAPSGVTICTSGRAWWTDAHDVSVGPVCES